MANSNNRVAYHRMLIRQNVRVKAARVLAKRYPEEFDRLIDEISADKEPSTEAQHAMFLGEGTDFLHVKITCACGEVDEHVQISSVYDWWRKHTGPVKK